MQAKALKQNLDAMINDLPAVGDDIEKKWSLVDHAVNLHGQISKKINESEQKIISQQKDLDDLIARINESDAKDRARDKIELANQLKAKLQEKLDLIQ